MANLWQRVFGKRDKKPEEARGLRPYDVTNIEYEEPAHTPEPEPTAEEIRFVAAALALDLDGSATGLNCTKAAHEILTEMQCNSSNSPSGQQLDYILRPAHLSLPKEQLLIALQKLASEYDMTNIFMENDYTIGAIKA